MQENLAISLAAVNGGLIMLFYLAVLLVGYRLARLGYDLLIKGVTGQFTFQAEFRGTKADVVSASPGIFFILMGAILISIAIIKDKTLATGVNSAGTNTVSAVGPQKLPDNPFTEAAQ